MYRARRPAHDSISTYLSQIRSKPLLTIEEEIKITKARDVAKKVFDEKPTEENLRAYREQVNKLVESNYGLVISIAKKHLSNTRSLTDLIQEGNMGLIRAAENFNLDKNTRFSTCAYSYIDGFIKRAIQTRQYSIKIPREEYDAMTKVARLRQEVGLDGHVTEEDVATAAKVPIRMLWQFQRVCGLVSFDAEIDYEDPADDLTAEKLDESCVQKDKLRNALSGISARERLVIGLRYRTLTQDDVAYAQDKYGKPVDTNREYTLEEIGELFGGISRQAIQQFEKRAIRKIISAVNV